MENETPFSRKIMNNKSSILALTSIILFLVGCTKYPDLYEPEREKDVSLTYYDNTLDYNQYSTYSIVDEVYRIKVEGDSAIFVTSDYSDVILQKIETNMASLGYVKVDTSESPDILVNAHVLKLSVDFVGLSGGFWDTGYYYDYPGSYYGSPSYWGYGGYSYYYPYSYPYYYSSTYGAVLIEMIDSKNMNNSTNQFEIIWSGIIAGTENTTTNIGDRIKSGIDECFGQSPYLNID